MTKYTILKGMQMCIPKHSRSIVPYVNKRRYKWTFKFTEESVYDLTNTSAPEDQYDWNKTCGVTWSFLDNKLHTFMVSHRWNLNKRVMEIAPYIHNNGSKEWVGGGGSYYDSQDNLTVKGLPFDLIKEVNLGDEVTVELIVNNDKTLLIKINGGLWYWYNRPMKGIGLLSKSINPYFGGSSTAPEKVSWFVEYD